MDAFKVTTDRDKIPPQIDGYSRSVTAGLDVNTARTKTKQAHGIGFYYHGKLYLFVRLPEDASV